MRDVFDLPQRFGSLFETAGIPQDDGGDHEVEPGHPVLLIFIRAVANFPEPVNERRALLCSVFASRS